MKSRDWKQYEVGLVMSECASNHSLCFKYVCFYTIPPTFGHNHVTLVPAKQIRTISCTHINHCKIRVTNLWPAISCAAHFTFTWAHLGFILPLANIDENIFKSGDMSSATSLPSQPFMLLNFSWTSVYNTIVWCGTLDGWHWPITCSTCRNLSAKINRCCKKLQTPSTIDICSIGSLSFIAFSHLPFYT